MVHQIGSKKQNSEKNSVYQKFSLPNFTLHHLALHLFALHLSAHHLSALNLYALHLFALHNSALPPTELHLLLARCLAPGDKWGSMCGDVRLFPQEAFYRVNWRQVDT